MSNLQCLWALNGCKDPRLDSPEPELPDCQLGSQDCFSTPAAPPPPPCSDQNQDKSPEKTLFFERSELRQCCEKFCELRPGFYNDVCGLCPPSPPPPWVPPLPHAARPPAERSRATSPEPAHRGRHGLPAARVVPGAPLPVILHPDNPGSPQPLHRETYYRASSPAGGEALPWSPDWPAWLQNFRRD